MSAPTADRSSTESRSGDRGGSGRRREAAESGPADVGGGSATQTFAVASPRRIPIGAVVSMTEDGQGVAPSRVPYDTRVVGVAAGHPAPGENPDTVYVVTGGRSEMLVNHDGGPIETGDLLVASVQPGVAMRARNRYRAIGAVVGKALEPYPWKERPEERKIRVLVTP